MKSPLAALIVILAYGFPAEACVEPSLTDPQVISQAQTISEAVVLSGGPVAGRAAGPSDGPVLMLGITKSVKGQVGPFLFVRVRPCAVPYFGKGSLVTAIRYPGGFYSVVRRPQVVPGRLSGR